MNLNATRQEMPGKATGAAEAIQGLRKVVDAHITPTPGTSQGDDIKPTVGGRKPTKAGADGDNESIAAFPQRVSVSVMIFLALEDDACRCAVDVVQTTAISSVEKRPIRTVIFCVLTIASLFRLQLMEILSNEDLSDVISWLPHGMGFVIYKKKKFAEEVLPRYFKQSKFTSFTRKLNRWGFSRISRGPESGAYFHKNFQRDNFALCLQMSCKHSAKSDDPTETARPGILGLGPPFDNGVLEFGSSFDHGMLPNNLNDIPDQNHQKNDILDQNQNFIQQQLQQLQFQQLQLQYLQMQQQQQLQLTEMMRLALGNQNQDTSDESNTDPTPLLMRSLEKAKDSGDGTMTDSQSLADFSPSLPGLMSSRAQPSVPGDPTQSHGGNGRAWAA
jgi:hypothetical protein